MFQDKSQTQNITPKTDKSSKEYIHAYNQEYYRKNINIYKTKYKRNLAPWVCDICEDKKVMKSPPSMHRKTKKHIRKLEEIELKKKLQSLETHLDKLKTVLH